MKTALRIFLYLSAGVLAYVLFFGLPLREPVQRVPWRTDLIAAQAESKATGKPLFLEFNASWCGPCQSLKSTLWSDENVAGALSNYVPVSLDVDQQQNQAAYLHYFGGDQGIPAFVVPSADGPSKTLVGAPSRPQFFDWLGQSTPSPTTSASPQ